MRDLLFLCHRIPYPPDKGEKIRAWHILKHLARTHRVHLGTLADEPVEGAHFDALRHLCFRVGCFPVRKWARTLRALSGLPRREPLTLGFFYSRALARWVESTFERYPIDRLYVSCSSMAPYVIGRPAAIRVLDLVDIDSEKWREYASRHRWPLDWVYRREARTLFALERRAVLDFDATLVVSEAEARCFLALAPECESRIGWLENGVDLEQFSPALSFDSPYGDSPYGDSPYGGRGPNLVFIGRMDYWPNVDAALWFAEEVLPLLREQCPGVRFHIIGASPARRVLRLGETPGVVVTGRVADVRPYLAHAEVAVAPLRIARGIQNKVLEAMAMARPVVATPSAFEGLRVEPGNDLLLATTPEEMAARIGEILAGRHSGLGTAARRAVERHHDWSRNLRRLDALFPPAQLAQERAATSRIAAP